VRRIPASTSRTFAALVGDSIPAIWCACEIDEIRLVIVAGFRLAARSATYNATVSALAGKDDWLCDVHQDVK
jgi:hypothetical protein